MSAQRQRLNRREAHPLRRRLRASRFGLLPLSRNRGLSVFVAIGSASPPPHRRARSAQHEFTD